MRQLTTAISTSLVSYTSRSKGFGRYFKPMYRNCMLEVANSSGLERPLRNPGHIYNVPSKARNTSSRPNCRVVWAQWIDPIACNFDNLVKKLTLGNFARKSGGKIIFCLHDSHSAQARKSVTHKVKRVNTKPGALIFVECRSELARYIRYSLPIYFQITLLWVTSFAPAIIRFICTANDINNCVPDFAMTLSWAGLFYILAFLWSSNRDLIRSPRLLSTEPHCLI